MIEYTSQDLYDANGKHHHHERRHSSYRSSRRSSRGSGGYREDDCYSHNGSDRSTRDYSDESTDGEGTDSDGDEDPVRPTNDPEAFRYNRRNRPNRPPPGPKFRKGTILVYRRALWEIFNTEFDYSRRIWLYHGKLWPEDPRDGPSRPELFTESEVEALRRREHLYSIGEVHKEPSNGEWTIDRMRFIADDDDPDWEYLIYHHEEKYEPCWVRESDLLEWKKKLEKEPRFGFFGRLGL
ncbi:hypothetical protein ABW19_dt0210350 [Dactylella cylindrospora]|nr:hypothetical protein ABW19_dt0210350 [Dactylella cylindrospora]